MRRYGGWIDAPEIEPPREVDERVAIDLALSGDQWKGLAVYVFADGPWTVFEEISGGLAGRSAEDWVRLAGDADLVYAGYNDAIGYGEFVYVDHGELVRHFLQDEQDASANVNVGKLPNETDSPMTHWADVATWVDSEEQKFQGRERGRLWIHRAG